MSLTPLSRKVVDFALGNGGAISAREALLDLDITSASLTRRLTEIESHGTWGQNQEGTDVFCPTYKVTRQRKHNPNTGKRYTRYFITTTEV